mgnify:CR=1 FL=1
MNPLHLLETMLTDAEEVKAIRDSVTVVPEALQEDFVSLPAFLAYWSHRYAAAVRAALVAEAVRKETEARAWLETRAVFQAEADAEVMKAAKAAAKADAKVPKAAKQTVDDIKATVAVRDDVRGAIIAEANAEAERERIRGVLDAVRAKQSALLTIGAAQRVEMEGNPSLRRDATRERRERLASETIG